MDRTPAMLEAYYKMEEELPSLLLDEDRWNSLYVDYHKPFVSRLWTQYGEARISLHEIHPCSPAQALYHTHDWPMATRILHGWCEVGFGLWMSKGRFSGVSVTHMGVDDMYSMTNPDAAHYVAPVTPILTVMLSGPPRGLHNAPKSSKILNPLSNTSKDDLLSRFRAIIEERAS